MKVIVEVRYDFYTNRVKFGIPHDVTNETPTYYECKEIGETFKKYDENNIKQFIGNCYCGLSIWKSVTIIEEKYRSNLINSACWQMVEDIKDYLKTQTEEIEVC